MVVFWPTELELFTLTALHDICHPAVAMLTGMNFMNLLQSAATIHYTGCTTDSLKRFPFQNYISKLHTYVILFLPHREFSVHFKYQRVYTM
jgi:hypothetical protein